MSPMGSISVKVREEPLRLGFRGVNIHQPLRLNRTLIGFSLSSSIPKANESSIYW